MEEVGRASARFGCVSSRMLATLDLGHRRDTDPPLLVSPHFQGLEAVCLCTPFPSYSSAS